MKQRGGRLVDPLDVVEGDDDGSFRGGLPEQVDDGIEQSAAIPRIGRRADFGKQHAEIWRQLFARSPADDLSQNIEPDPIGADRFGLEASGAPGAAAGGNHAFGDASRGDGFCRSRLRPSPRPHPMPAVSPSSRRSFRSAHARHRGRRSATRRIGGRADSGGVSGAGVIGSMETRVSGTDWRARRASSSSSEGGAPSSVSKMRRARS